MPHWTVSECFEFIITPQFLTERYFTRYLTFFKTPVSNCEKISKGFDMVRWDTKYMMWSHSFLFFVNNPVLLCEFSVRAALLLKMRADIGLAM